MSRWWLRHLNRTEFELRSALKNVVMHSWAHDNPRKYTWASRAERRWPALDWCPKCERTIRRALRAYARAVFLVGAR